MPTLYSATTTASSILASVSRDVRSQLDSTVAGDQTILLDYTDRIHQQTLRASKQRFLESDWKYFITEKGRTDYWLSSITGPNGAVLTGLGLTDIDRVREIVNFSSQEALTAIERPIFSSSYMDAAGTNIQGSRPLRWHKADQGRSTTVDTPLQLFPAPDAGNTFQAVPEAPICTSTASGSLPARRYYVVVAYHGSSNYGQFPGTPSQEVEIVMNASQVLVVDTPVPKFPITVQNGQPLQCWNVYVGTVSGGPYALQNTFGTLILGTDWQEPTSGLIAGDEPPTVSTLPPIGGYLIGFKYFKQRTTISATSTVLQVPDVYKDVVVAGVNWLAFRYLKMADEAAYWYQVYQDGLRQIIRDRNLLQEDADFIRPDPATVGNGAATFGFTWNK